MKTKQQYLWNALLLTAVTLLMRTVSVSFNVYVSNHVGAESMGLISLVSGVYGFAVTLATSGIHLATVRTVATRLEQSGGGENRRVLRACLSYAAFFGTFATLLLLAFSGPIALLLLRDIRTLRALRVLALTLLPIALSAVLNGYFTAVRRAWKNALTQVSEQAIKITLTCYFLLILAPKTTEGSMLAILAGGAVAESFSLLLNIVLYLLDKRHFRHVPTIKNGQKINVTAIAMPVAISAYMRSGLLAIEHILIPIGLSSYGAGNSAALAAYGTIQGMALPIVLYPAAILSSFSSLLIPEVTEQDAAGNHTEIRYIASRAYQLTLLFSIGVGAVMLLLSNELGAVLYDSADVSYFIRRLAPLVPIMYLDTATDAMLKGLGQQVYSMNVNIMDALISVIAVAILVPQIGIEGYLITIYITEIFNAALSIIRLLRVSGFRPKLTRLILRPMLAAIGATSIAHILFSLLSFPFGNGTLICHIIIAVLIYIFLLYLTNSFGKKDTGWLLSSLIPRSRSR